MMPFAPRHVPLVPHFSRGFAARGVMFAVFALAVLAFRVPIVSAQYGSLGAVKKPAELAAPATSTYTLAQAITPAPITPAVVGAPPIDPYATSSTGSTTLFAQSGIDNILPQTYQTAKRFRDRTSVDILYVAPTSSDKQLGVTELDLRCQFVIPLRCLDTKSPSGMGMPYLYLAPGAAFNWFKASSDNKIYPSTINTYAAYLDIGAQPRINQDVWLDAWVRVGVFSEYKKTTKDSVRVMGRVMGMFRISPEWDGAIGIIYLNRQRAKILPSGGLIWHPNADTILKLTFPDPKISKRIKATSDADYWVYLQGGYGGGVWTITDLSGTMEATDYNDLRLGIGLELERKSLFNGFFEFGGSFSRELYRQGRVWSAENTWYLRAGVVF